MGKRVLIIGHNFVSKSVLIDHLIHTGAEVIEANLDIQGVSGEVSIDDMMPINVFEYCEMPEIPKLERTYKTLREGLRDRSIRKLKR